MKDLSDNTAVKSGGNFAMKPLVPKVPQVPLVKTGAENSTISSSASTVAAPKSGAHSVKGNKPSSVIEHIRQHYSNYLDTSITDMPGVKSLHYDLANQKTWHSGVTVLFKELLNNSIDEYLQGYGKPEGQGKIIDVLCSAETITIRDYGRGIPHTQLRTEIQELGQNSKNNSAEIQFCEGLSGLGLKLVNALSSRFLLRSYREHKFAEIESSKGRVVRDRRGRCDKENGTFIRFTPDSDIFGKQSIRIPQLFDVLCKIAALYPNLEIHLNQSHVIKQKGIGDLFKSLPQWRKLNYLYPPCSLKGERWQLSFTHLAEWQNNDSGLHNERLVQSFVNGHACTGGLAGGLHVRQLQGAFLSALREVFPENQAEVDAFWDKGISLFWSLNLVNPRFQGLNKSHLLGEESEIAVIAQECRQQLLECFQKDEGLKEKFKKLLDDCNSVDEQDEYRRREARLTGTLFQVEEHARKLDGMLQGAEEKYTALDDNLRTVLNDSEKIDKHWKEVTGQLALNIEKTENDLHELKKLQRAEQHRYRQEEEKRLAGLEKEQEAYRKLKDNLQQQSREQQDKELQRQELIDGGLQNWNRLQQALKNASNLQKQRDLEQEQILQYLRSAKVSTEAEVGIVKQNIKLAEQKMLQRQENYLKNFQDNARDEFETIYDEIAERKQEFRGAMEDEQQKAYEKLQKLHERFSENLNVADKHWHERLEQVGHNSEEGLQRRVEHRQEALEHLDKIWYEQEEALEEYRQKQRNFLECWQERLDEGRREAQSHQDSQLELVRNRKELQSFLSEQKNAREEQAQVWQDWLNDNHKDLAENKELVAAQLSSQYEAQKKQQQEWEARLEEQKQEMEQIRAKQFEALESLGAKFEREVEEEVQQRLNTWLEHFEVLGQESEKHFIAQKKLIQTKQQTLENELALAQQEKDKLWATFTQGLSDSKETFDGQLEQLKQDQKEQQARIDETHVQQTKVLGQLQGFEQNANERMNSLDKNLAERAAELRKEIEASITELRGNTDYQLAQVEQSVQDQAMLHQQGLLEREQESNDLLKEYQKDFDSKLEQQYKVLEQWSESFAESFEEQKEALSKSLIEFSKDLKEKQEKNLTSQLGQWHDAFLAEQNGKEEEAAQEAQRKRNEFWQEQQLSSQEELLRQRKEFENLHKQLQSKMEREREHVLKELQYLQSLSEQQEASIENLSQNLTRNVEQRSELLKQEMEENYRQFYEDILSNTRELHQLNSDERKALRDDLAHMKKNIDDLNKTIHISENNLANVRKALPDSLKLQESLEGLAEKEYLLRELEQEISQLQSTLNENSQIGQKTSEQLATLLARRNELSEMEQQMEQVLELSGSLYQQRESLEQQQHKISSYQSHLDKLESLYNESNDLLELFDQRKEQLLEAASLLHSYNDNLSGLEQKIEVMQEQLKPLELGFGKAKELEQELEQQQQQLHSTQDELQEMQQAITELHADSQGIDKMREWIAKTETRMLELSEDIQSNLRTVETIVRKNRPNERGSLGANSGSKMDNDVRNTVVQLHSKKWSSNEIARATQLSVGEVELILEMLPSAS